MCSLYGMFRIDQADAGALVAAWVKSHATRDTSGALRARLEGKLQSLQEMYAAGISAGQPTSSSERKRSTS